MGKHDFVDTNGWLDKWKQRYHINFKKSHGESDDVMLGATVDFFKKSHGESDDVMLGATVDFWKERLPEILQGYMRREMCIT